MGDVLAADFKAKKYLGNLSKPAPVKSPLEDGLAIIAQAMAGSGIDGLAWPGMDVQAPYMAPDKDPA